MTDKPEPPARAPDEVTRLRERLADVEARQDETERLRGEMNLFRQLVEHSQGLMCVHDLDGNLLFVNPAAAESLGFRAEQGVGLNLRQFLAPAVREQFDAYLTRIREGPVDTGLMRLMTREGEERVWFYRNVRYDEPGQTPRVLGHAHDVTDRVRAERALRESERRFRLLADTAPVLIWMADESGRRTFVNRPWLEFTGSAQADCVGAAEWDAVHPEDRARCQESFTAAVTGRRAREIEYRLRRADGEYRWVLDRGVARVGADGAFAGMVGSCVDVTDARLAREVIERAHDQLAVLVAERTADLEQANEQLQEEMQRRLRTEQDLARARGLESLGLLAGEVAHEFNNLLTVITGRSQLLLERLGPDPAVRHQVTLIERTAQRAAGLSRQLLAFSRRQLIQPRPVDLNALVTDLLPELQNAVGPRIQVRTALAAGVPPVLVDPAQIERVARELVENSRDAMPEGGDLTVETARVDLDEAFVATHPGARVGPHVRITVRDTGIGMAETVRARVFEPFFTANTSGTNAGLGLAAVHGIVHQHRGHVAVVSEPGQGTTVEVWLPVAATAGGAGVASRAPDAGTVLLVDDEESVSGVIRDFLEEEGFSVLRAQHGVEALSIVRRHAGPIDLLVTDVVMPGMNGRELADRLQSLRPGLRVLYMSGHAAESIGRYGVLDPGVAFVSKPFTGAVLVGQVRALLRD